MKRAILSIYIILVGAIFPLPTVPNLDIDKFMGKWYVVSAIPTFAEKGCKNAYDIYTLNDDGTVDIQYYADKDGKPFTISQKAKITDDINKSTWKVSFVDPWIPLYTAPYEVIILDRDNYSYMVVGYPKNKYGWIMARSSNMSDTIYKNITDELEMKFGYDKNDFQKMIHE